LESGFRTIGRSDVSVCQYRFGSPEFVADVARFFDVTRGHVLLAGPKTIASVPDFARADRELVVVRSSMDPEDTLKRFAGRVVFIGGGPPVWDAYARFVSHWDVTRLPYDGPADRWFDARWLTGGGEVARNHRDQ
jgi:dihydromethanopterin reductase